MPRKHDSRGRSKSGGRFVALPHFMMETPAWRSLNPYGRAAYVEIAALYDGTNNGFLDMAVRRLADRMGVGKNVAHKALKSLVERGFIEPAGGGEIGRLIRNATAWRLTLHRCDRTHQPGSRAYARWMAAEPSPTDRKQIVVPPRDRDVPPRGTVIPLRSLVEGRK